MNFFDIELSAGVASHNSIRGRYFRVISGVGRLKLRTSSGFGSEIVAGIGVDLSANGAPFDWFELVSSTDQTITVLVSDLPSTDSRLSGDVDINGLLSVVNAGGSSYAENSGTIADTSSALLVPANTNRLKASVYIDQPCFVSGTNPATNAGYPLPAGHHVIENTAALYAYNESGSVLNFNMLEELK